MPSRVNDPDLQSNQMSLTSIPSQSTMSGCIAHISLSRILANILGDLYGIRQPTFETRLDLSEAYEQELQNWRRELLYLVDTRGIDPAMFQEIFLRQRNVLNLAFWHAQILVHRPFLLSAFSGVKAAQSDDNQRVGAHVRQCLNAALNIVDHVDRMNATGQIYKSYWFTQYFAFCAIVVLYVYSLQHGGSSEDHREAFEAGTRCQRQLSEIAAKGSLGERYGLVLQELHREVLRHQPPHQNPAKIEALVPDDKRGIRRTSTEEVGAFGAFPHGAVDPFVGASPVGSVGGITGWGQFDSLVTGGLADLDFFMANGGDAGMWNLNMSS